MKKRVPEDADRDFTAGALVIEEGEILLIKHSKLDTWLHPGGHIEGDETPDETAKRETLEETGIEIEFVEEQDFEVPESDNLPKPFNINLHHISEDHMHCAFMFLARKKEDGEASHSHEHDGMRWFSEEELRDLEDIPENLRRTALQALERDQT